MFDLGLIWDDDEAEVENMMYSLNDEIDVSAKKKNTNTLSNNPTNPSKPPLPMVDNSDHDDDVNVTIKQFLADNVSKQTNYKNRSAENRFQVFLKSLDSSDNRRIFEIPAIELDKILCQFFMTAEKIDAKSCISLGKLYQPDSLSSFQHSWQRILTENGSKMDIKTGQEFARSRKVLASRRKQLTSMGLGNKPSATRPLTDLEVDKLYVSGYFGNDSPIALQRSIWWKITVSFGYRARDESRKLQFGDIKLLTDENGARFLEWDKERGSKTRTGEKSNSHQRSFNPRAYANGGERCPVKVYEDFVSHRPRDACEVDSPFFLAMVPIHKFNRSDKIWYLNRPLGKNMLGEFLSKCKHVIPPSNTSRSKVANHSARKTSLSNLLHSDINPLLVCQLSGHKNPESLNAYHTASDQQQRKMSNILNRDIFNNNSNNNNNTSSSNSSTNKDYSSHTSSVSLSSQERNVTIRHSAVLSPLENQQSSGISFAGATITNCYVINEAILNPPQKKRRYNIIDDSSDEEN